MSADAATAETTPAPRGWARAGRIARRAAQALAVLVLLGVVAVVLVVRHYESGLPSVEQLEAGYDPPQVTRILARDGTLLGQLFSERRTVIRLDELPGHVKLAFLAAEDAHFYEHEGLDYLGMLRALFANLRAGRTVQGGSTITQQVVKNLLLEPERSYRRKIRETILARRLEQKLTKDQIFSLYLNHIYLGHGRWGVEEASRYYVGKHARELDVAEAATLAGIVAAPERLSPRHAPDKALERRRYVLGQMRDKGWMAPAVHDRLREAPLRLAPAAEEESDLCPEIVPEVVRLLGEVGGERARRGGFSVATSIDPALQTAARKAVRGALDAYAKRQKLEAPFTATQRRLWGAPFQGQPQPYKPYVGLVSATDDAAGSIDVKVGAVLGRVSLRDEERWNPKRLPPSEFTRPGALLRVSLLAEPEPQGRTPLRLELGPEAALVALDVATREVRALVGSYAALPGGLDRATRASRQPGSAFKAFVYGWAIESRRFHAASVLDLPANDAQPARRLLLREALARSDNAAAEALLEQLGAPAVVRFAQAAGIASRLEPTRSLALGAYEVVPIELAAAYATFAGGGEFAPPSMVTRLTGPDGKPIALPQRPPRRRVVDAETAWLVTSLLQSVVERGTGQRARALGRPVAGKTGTTNDARDAWFVGYSPELVAAVWVGYDDSKPLGWGEQGAVTALPAWIDFMRAAHERRPPLEFPRPPAIVGARIDPASGLLAWQGQPDAVEEVFLAGTVPSESAAPDGGLEAGDAAGAGAPDAGSPADGVAVEAAPPAAAPDATAPPKSPEQRIVEAGVEPPPF